MENIHLGHNNRGRGILAHLRCKNGKRVDADGNFKMCLFRKPDNVAIHDMIKLNRLIVKNIALKMKQIKVHNFPSFSSRQLL